MSPVDKATIVTMIVEKLGERIYDPAFALDVAILPAGITVIDVFDEIRRWRAERRAGITTSASPTTSADPMAVFLDEVKATVCGARAKIYGPPEANHATIAALWQTYLHRRHELAKTDVGEVRLSATDVEVMMILLKCARLAESPDHADSVRDIAGYAACLARVQQVKP